MLIHWYRISHWLWCHNIPFLPKVLWKIMYILFNSSVPASCSIGKNTFFAYGGIGVVIHSRAIIGNSCMIGQGVTIGGKSGWYEVPIIGNNVHISAGARVLGPIRVGNNVIIGANAVVVKDVPDNSIVAGVPAKIIKDNRYDFHGEKNIKYRGNKSWEMTPKAYL